MQNFKLVLEYDGAAFHGFQRQPNRLTVQEVLEKALSQLFNQPLKIGSASGRTDAGVHARYQVVHFFVKTNLNISQVQNGLNRYLPYTAAVTCVEKVPKSFHARYKAKSKTYEYYVWNHRVRSPLHAASSMHVPYDLNISRMKSGAKQLCGKHDFRSFCGSDPSKKKRETIRMIYRFEVEKKGDLVRFVVEADGFLYHMMRNLVGTLIYLGREKIALEDLEKILQAKDRKKASATAQAQGLFLINVTY
ncbi:MAG: tRNA pseudouridine(38-40) synthase TruA [Candidatus Omnitrophica bacterium]|nr:tRNA pseudouridine(38-40) synthase TruA [Candidatus Omnitrophota bacterium]